MLGLLLAWTAFAGAHAAERTALVVGNARYEREVGALRNTVNDARAVARTLRALGFEVIERTDVNREQLLKAVLAFRSSLADAQIGVFYFAGHGLSVAGVNYLVPLKSGFDPSGTDEVTRRLMAETRLFNVEQVVADMKSGGARCNLIILDACRTHALAGPGATRDAGLRGGLAEMSPPAGSLIAFATDAGHTALDGEGANGLYTSELLKHLRTPGLTVEQVFKRTRAGVIEASEGRQVPAEYSRLVGEDVYLAGPLAPAPPEPPPPETTDMPPDPPDPSAAAATAEPPSRAVPNEPPSQAEILKWATEGRFAETLQALEDQAAGTGPADVAFEPLNAVLEKVKNNLKDATSRSPEVEAAALACEWVLQVLPLCLKPEDKRVPGLTAKAHSRRGDALLILDDAQAALDEFDRALEIQPEDAYFRYNRGAALLALGRDEEARRDFRTAAGPKHNQPGARRLAQAALERMK